MAEEGAPEEKRSSVESSEDAVDTAEQKVEVPPVTEVSAFHCLPPMLLLCSLLQHCCSELSTAVWLCQRL